MLSLFDKNKVFSNRWDDNNSFAINNEINTMVPMMANDAANWIEATVVAVPAAVDATVVAVAVVVETTVVVVVVTVVIISSLTS